MDVKVFSNSLASYQVAHMFQKPSEELNYLYTCNWTFMVNRLFAVVKQVLKLLQFVHTNCNEHQQFTGNLYLASYVFLLFSLYYTIPLGTC